MLVNFINHKHLIIEEFKEWSNDPIPEAEGINIPEKSLEKEFDSFMSNSFGFGGTNVSLVLSKFKN